MLFFGLAIILVVVVVVVGSTFFLLCKTQGFGDMYKYQLWSKGDGGEMSLLTCSEEDGL
jgi:hypothetical protein